MGVYAQADRRFRRAQVTPARRRRAWHGTALRAARAAIGGAALVWAVHVGVARLHETAALEVAELQVSGNVRLSNGEVQALLEGLRGENLLFTDLKAWRGRLLASPWVADAALRRTLPATIDIVIAERRPAMLGRLGGRLYLVDASGVVIDEYGPQYAEYDLPVVDGLAPAGSGGQVEVDPRRARLASRLLAAVRDHDELLPLISQIDVSDARDAVVLLDGDPALIHLGEERFLERLESYLQLVPALRARVPQIDYVDLRFDERVYVRPAARTGRQGGATRR